MVQFFKRMYCDFFFSASAVTRGNLTNHKECCTDTDD